MRHTIQRGPLLAATVFAFSASPVLAQARYTIEQVLSPGFPYELISARDADRIAWIEYERGLRNVWTAAGKEFKPVRLGITNEDDGHDLTGIQISADGRIVAFLRGHAANGDGWVANPTSDPRGGERAVWAMSTAGGKPWRVVRASSFSLSPDGRWVLYERDGQIHRAPVNPGLANSPELDDAPPLFRVYGTNRGALWSPDGTKIAFVSDRENHSYIGVYDISNPRITYLAPGVDRDASPTWSSDGGQIVFVRRPGLSFGAQQQAAQGGGRGGRGGGRGGQQQDEQAGGRGRDIPGLFQSRFSGGHQLEIWMADVETGQGRMVWHQPAEDDRFSNINRITWADDHVLFTAMRDDWDRWYSISLEEPESQPKELTPDDSFVEYTSLSSDGRYLFFAANTGDVDRRDLFKVRVSGGKPEQLTKGDGIETIPAVLASGEQVAVLYADARRPLSVALVDADGGKANVITSLPEQFPLAQHVAPTNVVLTAPDSFKTNNQLFLPPNLRAGEKRPALVFIHGGPARQMLLGYHYMHFYHMAYAMNEYFANKGYIVLSVNYRSGIGYGNAFRRAPNTGGRGNAEYQDVLAAGLYLRGRPDVDPARIGVWGLSYGGVLTAQALARNSDIFSAGVDMAGVHLWGNSLEPESVSFKASAIGAVGTWKSPVLLMHGDDDRNVAFSQTVGLVQLLRAHNVPFELIVFPDDVHDSLLFHRWIQAFGATDEFFDRVMIRKQALRADGGSGR
jgi:dipeptidyl aminopeptidase/acylaminoacyl peptidase